MSDAQERVTCPSCGKGYRWQAKLIEKHVPCKACGAQFIVPYQPGEGIAINPEPSEDGYELDLEPPQASAAVPANAGKCPSCNSPVRPGAVICMNCGFNMAEGKKMQAAEVTALPKEEKKAMRRELSGMKWVRTGLWMILFSILLIVLMVPVTFGAVFADLDVDLITDIMILVSMLVGFIGGFLCLAAPKASKAKPVAIVSILLGIASATISVLIAMDKLSENYLIAGHILDQLESIGFLIFFVLLARFLEFDQITERAQKVLALYITLAVILAAARYLAIFPLVGCFTIIFVIGLAIRTFFLYILLLIDLNNALTHHIREQSE